MKLQFYPASFRLLFFICINIFPLALLAQPSMRANLHVVTSSGSTVLMDGNLTNYDDIYSNSLDMYDAWKMNNFSENFGILRSNSVLVIERRKNISISDTTFFKMWNMQYRNYRLQIITKNFSEPGMRAVLIDKFLNTKTNIRLNDTNYINFTVNANAASWNSLRFQLIYSNPEIPLKFISFSGSKADNAIRLAWTVAYEKKISKYVVEQSFDGMNFKDLAEVTAQNLGNNNYSFTPVRPFVTDNYYRIKAQHADGTVSYSEVTKVDGEVLVASVFPNPVTDRAFHVRVKGITSGNTMQLVGLTGVVFQVPAANVSTIGMDLVKVTLPSKIQSGIYKLKILFTNNTSQVVTVRVQ
jgi:hypothetical protein